MSSIQIKVFISHAWSYSDHYDILSEWIFENRWNVGDTSLYFRDYSVPKDDPIHHAHTDYQLRQALYNQIANSHVIVIPTGMYANYSEWIQKEIDGSVAYSKPILAVNPWGAQRTSNVVSDAADETVGWNKKAVVGGVWKLYK